MISPQQAKVNADWMAYWNGQGERPLEGTYFTGWGSGAKEAPDASSRQAALDYYGPTAPLPTVVTVDKTASLLDVMTANGVHARHYADVVRRNGGKTVVDAGGTVNIPAYLQAESHYGPAPSTNALNGAAGTGQGANGASSVFPRDERNYSLNGSPVNRSFLTRATGGVFENLGGRIQSLIPPLPTQPNQTPFQRDLMRTGIPRVGSAMVQGGLAVRDLIAKRVGAVQGARQELLRRRQENEWNQKNAASLYFNGYGIPPLGATPASVSPVPQPNPVNTGFPFVAPSAPQTKEERDYLLATDLPTDKYALERIEQVKALRAATNDPEADLPYSIPLNLATLTWGEQGINEMLGADWLAGRWVIEGQSLVWKQDAVTPTPETNGPWNGIYQIPEGQSNTYGYGRGGTGYSYAQPTGVAAGVLNLRLSTG